MDTDAFWSARAQYYKDYNEINTFPPTVTLANMLEIQKSEDIIEIACATGVFSVHYLRNLTNVKTFISSDVSEKMIELAKARKEATEGINKDIKHEFVVADAQDLSSIKDESMDTYISNMCIHMVSDPNKFLQEAKRVLKKGGKIGLTVPTRFDGLMAFMFGHFEKAGFKLELPRDPFRFGYREKMIELLQENGFEVRYCWDDHFKLPYYDDADIDFQLNHGEGKGPFMTFDEEKKKEVRENILKGFNEMKKNFTPLQMKLVSIVAQKPL